MDIFFNIYNNWSNIEKIYIISLYITLFILIIFVVKIISQNKTLVIFSIISLIASGLLTILSILFLTIVLDVDASHIFLLTPILILLINMLNIGTCIGYFNREKKKKDFHISKLKKEFVKDSIQLSIFLSILFGSLSIFLSSTLLTFILLTLCISLGVIWLNYAILYKLVK